jgi:hypothetical protein
MSSNITIEPNQTNSDIRSIILNSIEPIEKGSKYDSFGQGIVSLTKKGPSISYTGLTMFINHLGYCYMPNINYKARQKAMDDCVFYKNSNNILEEVSVQDIYEDVLKQVENSSVLKNQSDGLNLAVKEMLSRQKTTLFSSSRLNDIKRIEYKNTKLSGKVRVKGFKNCVIVFDLNNRKPISLTYEQLSNDIRYRDIFIFKDDITDKNITLDNIPEQDYINNDFYHLAEKYYQNTTTFKFLTDITQSSGSNVTLESLLTLDKTFETIGYINRGYHSTLNRKLVFFVDGEDSEASTNNGRRGKTILLNLVHKYNSGCLTQANNSAMFDDKFMFGSLDPNKHVLNSFNDIDGKKVDLRALYTLIDGLRVERKGQDAYNLDPNLIPIPIITCNHLPKFKVSEQSALDRVTMLEFSRHFGIGHTPYDKYKEMLGEWPEEHKWSEFFNLMIALDFKYRLQESNKETLKFIPHLGQHALDTALKVSNGSDTTEFVIDCLDRTVEENAKHGDKELVFDKKIINQVLIKIRNQLYGEIVGNESNAKMLENYKHAKQVMENVIDTLDSKGWSRCKDENGKPARVSVKLLGSVIQVKLYKKKL